MFALLLMVSSVRGIPSDRPACAGTVSTCSLDLAQLLQLGFGKEGPQPFGECRAAAERLQGFDAVRAVPILRAPVGERGGGVRVAADAGKHVVRLDGFDAFLRVCDAAPEIKGEAATLAEGNPAALVPFASGTYAAAQCHPVMVAMRWTLTPWRGFSVTERGAELQPVGREEVFGLLVVRIWWDDFAPINAV